MLDKNRGKTYWTSGDVILLDNVPAVDLFADNHNLPKPKICWLGGLKAKDYKKGPLIAHVPPDDGPEAA